MTAFKVYNAGRPGDTTVELLERFDKDVAARFPELVCLLIGGNDMFYPGHIIDIEDYRSNLLTILDRIEMGYAKTILFTAPQFYRPFLIENFPDTLAHPLSTSERFELLNSTIREIATRRRIPLIDLEKLLLPVDDSADSMVMNEANSGRRDGMHLTASGLKIMAGKVFELHQKEFPQARTVVCFGDSITYGVYMPGKGTAEIDALTYPGQLCNLLNNSR